MRALPTASAAADGGKRTSDRALTVRSYGASVRRTRFRGDGQSRNEARRRRRSSPTPEITNVPWRRDWPTRATSAGPGRANGEPDDSPSCAQRQPPAAGLRDDDDRREGPTTYRSKCLSERPGGIQPATAQVQRRGGCLLGDPEDLGRDPTRPLTACPDHPVGLRRRRRDGVIEQVAHHAMGAGTSRNPRSLYSRSPRSRRRSAAHKTRSRRSMTAM
jgi:hypothetical protein